MHSDQRRPLWIWTDTAATCNLACKVCYTIPMQSASLMSLDIFDKLVARLRQTSPATQIVEMKLNWRGEPTSNPRLAEMLGRLNGCGWRVLWHTNATLLHPKRAAAIVEANPDQHIYLSLDGGTAASFEDNRGAGMWEKALRGTEALLAARGNRPGPTIGIYQLDLGVPPESYDPRFLELIGRVDNYVVEKPVDLDGAEFDEVRPNAPIPRGPCFWLGNVLAIDTHGQAWTCLLRNGTKLGSILTESVDDLLDRAAELRSRVEQRSRSTVPGCASCRKKEGRAYDYQPALVS
ncbi:MAG: radical SAM protein [Sporichthyaceae bacterium]|nr:radical SAM protein [Sporichthyaceae bacterium]